MTREHNWADNYTFKAVRIHRPTTIDDVRRLVSGSAKIHAIGARHSFNGIADSPGDLVDLSNLDPEFVIDREQQTVTVGAATSYGMLASHLQTHGWALHNMASLPHISVAGAIATGTHGSGDKKAISQPRSQDCRLSPQLAISLKFSAAPQASTVWWSGSARSVWLFA